MVRRVSIRKAGTGQVHPLVLLKAVARAVLVHPAIAAVGMALGIAWIIVLVSLVPLLPVGIGLLLVPVLIWLAQAGASTMATLLRFAGVEAPQPRPLPVFAWNWERFRALVTSRDAWRVLIFTGLLLLPIGIVSTIAATILLTVVAVLGVLPMIATYSLPNGVLAGWPHTLWGKLLVLFLLLLVSLLLAPLLVRIYGVIYRLVVATDIDAEAARRRVADLEASRRITLGEEARQLRALERNLHDGPQQVLVRTGMDLSLAQRRLDEGKIEDAKEALAQARQHTADALEQLRSLVRGFAPPVLAERGLTDAFAVLAANSPVPTSVWSILPSGWRIEPTVEQTLYFIASECLANAGKHAKAQHVELTLDEVGGHLRLGVRDNGIGGAQVLPGHGLEGIARRASSIDAIWQLQSDTSGTNVTVVCSPQLRWR